jgi:hypothetical protein
MTAAAGSVTAKASSSAFCWSPTSAKMSSGLEYQGKSGGGRDFRIFVPSLSGFCSRDPFWVSVFLRFLFTGPVLISGFPFRFFPGFFRGTRWVSVSVSFRPLSLAFWFVVSLSFCSDQFRFNSVFVSSKILAPFLKSMHAVEWLDCVPLCRSAERSFYVASRGRYLKTLSLGVALGLS